MEKNIDIKINTRYFTFGNPNAKNLLVVLHGYGHLASYFLKKFEFLNPDNYYVVAPEGLHRFYLNGTGGRVGASWMTKEDRENDIKNYVKYLDEIFDEVNSTTNFKNKILLGFSQGGATGSRYMAFGKHSFHQFILWAAVFPPDLSNQINSKFDTSKNYFVVGNRDPYYNEQQIANHLVQLKKEKLQIELIKFDGEHEINSDVLLTILE